MSSITDSIVKALRETIDQLLGKKNKQTTQNINSTKPDHLVRTIKPLIQSEPAHSINRSSRAVSQAPVPAIKPLAKETPTPTIEVEPKAFFQWAGNDLARWKLLIGASVSHTFY